MSPFTPRYLKKGDTVGIVSPARHINRKQVEPTIKWLNKFGLNVELGPNMFNILDQMAGSDSDKIHDFQDFIDDPNIQAILCSRGGYGSVRILDQLNFQPVIDKKKWIPAINRFRTVTDEYETTIYTEEALHRLVEIHYILGLTDEAKKYANLLGYNYQSSEWYEQTYKVFNKKYEKKKKEKNKKKNKITKTILNKIKSLAN